MFKKNEKYTMEQFKEMFDNAKKNVIEKETKNNMEKLDDPMAGLMINVITIKTIDDIGKELFGDEKEGDE